MCLSIFEFNIIMTSLELFDLGFNTSDVCSFDRCNFRTSLVELEGWHAVDATSLRGLFVLINVDLDKDGGISELFGQLDKFWTDHLAWRTPSGGEIDNDELLTLESFIELGFGLELLYHLFLVKSVLKLKINYKMTQVKWL